MEVKLTPQTCVDEDPFTVTNFWTDPLLCVRAAEQVDRYTTSGMSSSLAFVPWQQVRIPFFSFATKPSQNPAWHQREVFLPPT
jgi:uncharacterized protein YciI